MRMAASCRVALAEQKVYPRRASRNAMTRTTLVDIRLLANSALHCSMSMLATSHAGGDACQLRLEPIRRYE
jgi:hypothetical protein